MVNWVNKHKNFTIALIISLLVFVLLLCMSYIIYIYGYYDKIRMNRMIENYNSYKFDRVYNDIKLEKSEFLNKEVFINMTDIMYNKKNLEKIYNNYYLNSKKYNNIDDFIKTYFYGYKEISNKDVEYYINGKSGILSRSDIKIINYNIYNGYGDSSKIGIIKDIIFSTSNNSTIKIDGKELFCNGLCKIDYLFSGVHSLEYIHDGFTYYSIILIDKDNSEIDVNRLNNLIAISDEIDIDNSFDSNKELKLGIYSLNKCNYGYGCPSEYSYITLNKDNSCGYYTYISVDKSGDSYLGTYKIENGYIIMNFTTHSFSVIDSNTKKDSEVKIDSDIKMTFKIDSDESFSNKDYIFKFKA